MTSTLLRRLTLSIFCTLLCSGFAAASPITIGFEDLTDNTTVRNYYQSSLGVTFKQATAISAGLSLNELDFPPHSGSTVVYDNTAPIEIDFTTPTTSAFAFFTYTTKLTLSAFDVYGHLIASTLSGFNDNTVSSGDVGSSSNERLGFTLSSGTISALIISGDPTGSSFVMDDLTFATKAVATPEPPTFLLLVLPTILIFALRYNKRVAVCAMVILSLYMGSSHTSFGQTRPRPAQPKSAASAIASSAVAASVSGITNLSISPSSVPNSIPTTVTVLASVSGAGLLPNGVLIQELDNLNRVVKTFGTIADNGIGADKIAGDGIFTGTFVVNTDSTGTIRLVASAAYKNQLLRKTSSTFFLEVNSETGVSNSDDTFWGGWDGGGESISVYFVDPPSDTKRIQLLRSPSGTGTWTVVQDLEYDAATFPSSLVDVPGSTQGPLDYEVKALGADGSVLRTYSALTVPKYVDQFPQSSLDLATPHAATSQAVLQANANALSPLVNTAFITDAIMEDASTMTKQQIRDLLAEKGSFLKTPTIDDTIMDSDGTSFSPALTIWDLAQLYRINPQLILVTMQKESGLITQSSFPPSHGDGYMGAKGCTKTLLAQLNCGVQRLRGYLTAIDTNGHTIGGWAPNTTTYTCAGNNCSLEHLPVTPPNRATAALWQYTPVVGALWGGTQAAGGQASVVKIWYPSLFRNLANIVRWRDCGFCPQAPEVYPSSSTPRGQAIGFGLPNVTPAEFGIQAVSDHGLSGGLPANSTFTVRVDYLLHTWDSYNARVDDSTGYWDAFVFSISSKPYWQLALQDPIFQNSSVPFVFGGNHYGDGISSSIAGLSDFVISANATVNSYLNIMLDTATAPQSDSNYPSWGNATVLKVIPSSTPGTDGIISMPF